MAKRLTEICTFKRIKYWLLVLARRRSMTIRMAKESKGESELYLLTKSRVLSINIDSLQNKVVKKR